LEVFVEASQPSLRDAILQLQLGGTMDEERINGTANLETGNGVPPTTAGFADRLEEEIGLGCGEWQ
jgi:hypothetical protein